MIPILFKENETNFNTNGIAVLDETIDYIVTEERNGLFDLELEYPASGRWLKEFKDFRLISAKPNDEDESHLFRIYEIVKSLETQTIRVYASTRSNDLGGNMVSNVEVKSATAQDALNKMKADLIEPTNYNFVSDIQTRSSTQWIRRNPLNCIAGEEGSMVQYWGGELKRTNDTIFLYSRRGRDRVTEVRPGKNLEGFTMTTSTKGMITRILPYITFVPEGKQDEVTLIGSIVNSPLMNNYPVKYIVPVDYSGDQEITSLTQLNNAAKDYFTYQNPGCDKPNVTLDIDLIQLSDSSEYSKFKDLEHIALTDTVVVWVEKYDVDVEVKVNEVSYSGMMGQVTNIVAGNQKHGLYDDVKHDYKSSFNELQKYVSGMENGIRNTIQLTADGKNRIFRGYTEPDISLSKENDLWYKQLGSGEVEVYIFDGAYWQPLITAGLNEAVKAEVRKMLDQAEADRVAAEQGIADAITAANEYADQQVIEFDDKVNAVRLDATDAMDKAEGALTKAEQAVIDAGFAKTDAGQAKTNAATALENANTAKSNASTALTNANTAISTANTAKSNASTALTNASSALNRVGAVEETTGTLSTSYDNLTRTVALKADQTTVDGIKGTVTTQGTAITANATAIGLKADKSFVDTINGTVTKHTTDIKANSEGLKLKADSTTVNSIKGTVDTHTTQIKAASDGLTLKADKSQVDTIKGTVDKHTLDISATATAVGLKADKSLVDTIKGTVDKHTLDIKAAADGLTLKADSSLVNSIKGTVDTHTTQISANSTAISARLTSAQVETLLTGKKYVNETKLTATANGLSANITQVSNDLSGLEIGGRNLARLSSMRDVKSFNSFSTSDLVATLVDGEYIKITRTSLSTSRAFLNSKERVDYVNNFVSGDSITLSIDVYIESIERGGSTAFIRWLNSTGGMIGDSAIPIGTDIPKGKWVRLSQSFVVPQGVDISRTTAPQIGIQGLAVIRFRNWKIEKGNKPTDWTPAPEDMATLEQFTTIDATVKGIQTTVGTKADKSQITQLSTQISSKVESSTYNSKMTQLDSAISSKVASSTYTSKMTQLDNAINLRVVQKDVTDAILADKTIKDTRATNQLPSWYFSTYPKQTVEEFKQRTAMGVPGSATYGQLTTKVIWNSTSGGVITQIFSSSDGVFQRQGNAAATAWGAWDKIAEAGKLLSQINLSTEGVLIQGKRIQLDGDVTMTAAYVNILNAKTLDAITANITTIRSKVLTTDVVLSTHIKSDTALITKLFATDANVGVLTAKTAFVNAIKATTLSADKITGGTFNGSKMTVINIAASAINAGTLSAISANTGDLNVDGWLTISAENKGIKASYDYGDPYGGSFNARWFVGDFRFGYRYISMDANVYEVTPQNTRGAFRHKTVSYIGPDYFKFRQYNSAGTQLYNRIDIAADYISMADKDFNNTNIMISSNGSGYFSNDVRVAGDLWVSGEKALKAYYVQAPETANNMYLNGGRNELGSMRLGKDGSTLNGGRLVSSDSVYKRTYSSAANVIVFDTGTIGRSVSARKYKLNIKNNDLLDTAIKTLEISPSTWFDRGEVESISENLTNETLDDLDGNFKLQRHHGFIADEFHEKGATEVVVYDSDGEVEGLAYDRISMYHHVLIKDLYKKIEKLESELNERTSN